MTDVLTRSAADRALEQADWWRQAVVYQVYPRSFADTDGDGIGDLRGIRSRVPYLRGLGVDAVWLSPFYPSALADGGYDVDDYRDVDPRLGTLADFDDLVASLHEAGIRVVVDIVPNHTSDRHEWFREALASPRGSAARHRYVFRDGLGPDGALPPSDWTSIFGGSAWEPVGDGQWYLHVFAREQPDLNWDDREVRDDFLTTLRFWSDRGVDGFRIDVAHGLAKRLDDELPDQATLDALPRDGAHPLWDRDEVHDIYADWRRAFDEYSPPRTAVAEAWVASHRRPRYASIEGLGQSFNFDLLAAPFEAGAFRRVVAANLALAAQSGSSTTWVLSNHDVVRHATRYGLPEPAAAEKHGGAWLLAGGPEAQLDRERGLRRARAASLFMLALPGSAYLYQGEELGLHEVADIPPAERQDPSFLRNPGVDPGRDGCRVPLPWAADGPSFGFGPGGSHLPQPDWFREHAAEAQEREPGSTLSLYRRAIALRHDLQGPEELEWLDDGEADVVRFRRPGGCEVAINFGTEPARLPPGEVLVASGPLVDGRLPGETAVWLRR
ncbi:MULTISPECIES: glycoside hydrolase family 13 protein [unclassified Agromyces]|uniref:glycoside hydrolase family 13 protein n=1 Tax=unclassified Agromyces TaxID=2639701 RepID=UPI0030157349